jgi:hypothetical protein
MKTLFSLTNRVRKQLYISTHFYHDKNPSDSDMKPGYYLKLVLYDGDTETNYIIPVLEAKRHTSKIKDKAILEVIEFRTNLFPILCEALSGEPMSKIQVIYDDIYEKLKGLLE